MARQPDLVILDLRLPDMNGLDVLRTIRDPDKRIRMPPVITLSNFQDSEVMVKAFKLGAIAAIPKSSLSLESLSSRVAGWLKVKPI
jgi:two-component system response regulator AtoC